MLQKLVEKVAWQLLYRDCAFPMAGSSIVTNPMAHRDQYARARVQAMSFRILQYAEVSEGRVYMCGKSLITCQSL